VIWDILDLAQGGHSALKIPSVPQDDRGDEQVEAGGPVLLVFIGPIADFTEAMDEHGARQTVAGFAFVELLTGRAPQFRVVDPVEGEQRASSLQRPANY
jgi:hypothetical protein